MVIFPHAAGKACGKKPLNQIKIMTTHAPKNIEIANNYALWMEYVDPSGIDSKNAFEARTIAERLEIIKNCFGE